MYPHLFLLTELSSSSVHRNENMMLSLSEAVFYRDERGYLIPLIAGSFHYTALVNNEFIIGIFIDDDIHPIYNRARQQIVVTNDNPHSIVMTEEMHRHFDSLFVRLRSPSPPQRIFSRTGLGSPSRSHQGQQRN